MAKLKKRRRKKGEVCTRRQAIRNFCMECMGYQIAEIRKCTAKECWLYPWRLGALDPEVEKEEVEVKEEKKEKKTRKTKCEDCTGTCESPVNNEAGNINE